ncbi:hypothetical protein [Treponema primitia]|nr:hypothetical protein [Treponema primitia]
MRTGAGIFWNSLPEETRRGSIGRLYRHPAVGLPRPHRRFSDVILA